MRDLHLLVGGMGCRHCVREVTARLRDVPGVERVVADASRNHVLLSGSMTGSDVMGALSGTAFVARIIADARAAGLRDDRARTAAEQGHP